MEKIARSIAGVALIQIVVDCFGGAIALLGLFHLLGGSFEHFWFNILFWASLLWDIAIFIGAVIAPATITIGGTVPPVTVAISNSDRWKIMTGTVFPAFFALVGLIVINQPLAGLGWEALHIGLFLLFVLLFVFDAQVSRAYQSKFP